jgi:tRNA wybutosine-synthesizing protein 1
MLSKLNTRTVLRITLIRNYNDDDEIIPAFASMLKNSSPNFVEIKSYMHIGRSTNRLEHDNMLDMDEVRHFASKLSEQSEIFSVMDESFISKIVVLQNQERFIDRLIPTYAQTN